VGGLHESGGDQRPPTEHPTRRNHQKGERCGSTAPHAMKHRLLLPVLFLLVLVVAACAPPPNLLDDTLLQDESLITGEPCAPPCFRGITPGETRWNDALTIIEDDAEFRDVQTQADENSNAVQAAWRQGDNQVCCQIASQDGEIVTLVLLRTAPTMTLGELLDEHGDPAYLVGSEFTVDQAVISLVYPETPMVVYVYVAGAEEGELSDSSEIIGMLYLTEEEMDLLLETTELHAWEGYQTYQAYQDGEFEITPSITLTPVPEG